MSAMAPGREVDAEKGASRSFQVLSSKGSDSPERSPSAGFEAQPDGEQVGASVSSGVYNLATSIVGAGIMALPAKMETTGLPMGLILLVVFGFVCEYSMQVLVRGAASTKVTTYADLMGTAYGRIGRQVTNFLLIVLNYGILIIYLIMISDVLSGTDSSTGLLEEWVGHSTWWSSRAVVSLMTCVFILGPLVALEHIDSLHWSSFLAIALAGIFVVVTVVVATIRLFEGTIDFTNINWVPSVNSGKAIIDLFTVVPTISVAYVGHYSVHPIYAEMATPKEANMTKVVRTSVALVSVIYLATGLFGYLLFGNSIQADILENFDSDLRVPGSNALDDLVRATFVIHLMMVFPIIQYSLRASLNSALFSSSIPLSHDKPRFITITVVNMVIIFLLANLFPNVETAFDFTGSLCSVSLAFTLPGLIAVSSTIGRAGRWERVFAWTMVVMGLAFSILGLIGNVENVINGSSS